MSDVFEVLKQDHNDLEDMLARLTASGPQGTEHINLAEKLVIEESKHEAAEEMYLWPAVRQYVPGGDQLTNEALRQEHEGKQVLDQLRKTAPVEGLFEELIHKFARAGREHIAFEEEHVWPKLRLTLPLAEQKALGRKIQEAKDKGPTRPHPHTADSPAALKTLGAAAAQVDKARDAATDRRR
ncbi:MAG: hemerythrin domain-containing protein [Acidimicrobiaceae bacterium]|nr:hemerythrin domain-containing protein [Acidimicrobiaceae bacterium]